MTSDDRRRLAEAVRAVRAPEVVFALSRYGRRTVVCGGDGLRSPHAAACQRYEIGSATKVFTGLLLAHLAQQGLVDAHGSAARLLTTPDPDVAPGPGPGLGPGPGPGPGPGWVAVEDGDVGGAGAGAGVRGVTLTHLATHTSALPRLPRDFYPQALPHWSRQPYAGYGTGRLVAAFLRARPLRPPGAHWHYSNFGVSVLGHALGAATATSWQQALTRQVLRPMGLRDTRLHPTPRPCTTPTADPGPDPDPDTYAIGDPDPDADVDADVDPDAVGDAVGHRADGVSAVPGLDAGGFAPAGGVRATPADLLAFLEAHLDPAGSPLRAALSEVRQPMLRRGRRGEEHTLTWFRHPAAAGPLCFHAGATSGQQAFLGFQPATGTALAALCTRRHHRGAALVPAAYALLADPP